jgi:hypothetical protein
MEKPKSKTLSAALQSFAGSLGAAPHMGEAETPAGPALPSAAQVQLLRNDLQRIIHSNENYFRMYVGLLLVLFVGACVFVYTSMSDPKYITAVFTATGVSIMGVVTQMFRAWKEKVNSDLLLTLIGTLSGAELKKVVDSLLKSRLAQK